MCTDWGETPQWATESTVTLNVYIGAYIFKKLGFEFGRPREAQ